jgi:uncharacterized OsmC-like protein
VGIDLSEKSFVTKLQLIDNYKFNVKTDLDYMPDFTVDETKPDGEGTGPNPTRLLSAAVGHCMSSSLIFCLKKARIPVQDLSTTVETSLYRNENGRLRIKNIEVQINLKVDKEHENRVNRCLSLFEDYCTVTQSIRKGIQVNVKVQ